MVSRSAARAEPPVLEEAQLERVGFVLGQMRRTGTSFLYSLLLLHPDTARVREKVWEDFLLVHARHLERFVGALRHEWDPAWGIDEGDLAALRRSLGLGLAHFVRSGAPAELALAKTPSVVNLHRFFDYFPKGKVAILVRDGRAVVESGVRSFGWNRDEAIRKWAESARAVLAFDAANAERRGRDYLVVRYEALYARPRESLAPLLAMLGLDPGRYPWDGMGRLPVRGSSSLGRNGGRVHWSPVAPTSGFKPLERFEGWSAADHARFNWLAGAELEALGYRARVPERGLRTGAAWNRVLDAADWSGRLRAAVRRVGGRQL